MNLSHWSKWKQAVVLSLFVIFAAQINLDIFTSNFRVSLGILVIPISIFLLGQVPLSVITLLSGLGVYLSRLLLFFARSDFSTAVLKNMFPETIFYFSYGFLTYLYFKRHQYKFQKGAGFFFLFLMDYAANFMELLLRLGLQSFELKLQVSILIVAGIRTLLLWAVITGLSHYRLVLISKEHSERYQRLILLISKLNEEVIWMKKNTALIEDTMQRSYQLFSQIQAENADTELSHSALAVAKDIHEVKKEYMLILRGISEALDLNLQDDSMTLPDMMILLRNSAYVLAAEKGITLQLETQYEDAVFTDKHFFLLSVFRNLLTNALEACDTKNSVISFTEKSIGENYVFMVSDNGPGISEENLADIFTPGFSTKINFDTGEINRGLGLNLVKDVIEKHLSGMITVQSKPGSTIFTITIPKKEMEVI